MGLEVHSRVVVGVPTNKIYRVEKVKGMVIRYNEITGEPYKTKVNENQHILIPFGKTISEDDFEGLDVFLEDIDDDLQHFYFDSGLHNNPDVGLIGFQVCEMGGKCEKYMYYEIHQKQIETLKKKFKKLTGLKPNVYLTMFYSY